MNHVATPQIVPSLAELLRTCVAASPFLLQIVRIRHIDLRHDHLEHVNNHGDQSLAMLSNEHRFATNLLLSDGQLIIQGLLHRKLSASSELSELGPGDIVDIKQFDLKKSNRLNGNGHVIYLGIKDCHFIRATIVTSVIDQSNIATDSRKRARVENTSNEGVLQACEDTEGGFVREVSRSPKRNVLTGFGAEPAVKDNSDIESLEGKSVRSDDNLQLDIGNAIVSPGKGPVRGFLSALRNASRVVSPEASESEDDIDDFETVAVDMPGATKRREVLRRLETQLHSHTNYENDNSKSVLSKDTTLANKKTDRQQIPNRKQVSFDLGSPHNNKELPTESKRELPSETIRETEPDTLRPEHSARHIEHKDNKIQPKSVRITQPGSQPVNPPFHTLQSLRSPPPSQPLPRRNYTVTVLGIITWVGTTLIHRPGSPFPPKRHIRIEDPSLHIESGGPGSSYSKIAVPPSSNKKHNHTHSRFTPEVPVQGAVTVAVYLDAASFKPRTGSLALLRGLVMQRLSNGDIILNVYSRVKDIVFAGDEGNFAGGTQSPDGPAMIEPIKGRWFVDDVERIRQLGYAEKVDDCLSWWAKKTGDNE